MSFLAQRLDYECALHIAWVHESFGKRACAKEVVGEFHPVDGPLNTFLRLDIEEAQSLMNALYKAGLRPTDAKPQDETIKAMAYHLEDMRALVFKKGLAK